MDTIAFFSSIVGSIITLGVAYISLRGTLLDISHLKENAWPLLWYLSIFLVIIPLVIVSAVGIDNIPVFFVAWSGLEQPVTLITIATLVCYLVTLGFFLRLLGLVYKRYYLHLLLPNERKLNSLALSLCLFGLSLLVSFSLFGYKHAFLYSLVEGTSVLKVRLANKYTTYIPSQVQSLLPLVGYALSIVSGYLSRYNGKRSVLFLLIAVIILSAPGDKAFPVKGIILWILGNGKWLPKRIFSGRMIIFIVSMCVVGFGGGYLTLSRQVPDLSFNAFAVYLLNRFGVGQMAGMYETFALFYQNYLPEGNYFWHIIPGARFLVDYIDYHKMLMMITEGVSYTEMGVKNTYFLAEAWAIGGPVLGFVSPIIVGFSYALGLYLTINLMRVFFGKGVAFHLGLPIYLLTHDITGGFSVFPLLKGVFLLALQLIAIRLFYFLLSIIGGVMRDLFRFRGFVPGKGNTK